MTLQVSDLFLKKGYSFDYQTRIDDQNKLIERLRTSGQDALADSVAEFAGEGIASMVFIEHILDQAKAAGVEIR